MSKTDKPLPGPGTVIGANVKLVGTIRDVNDITVHGIVEGEVISEKTVTIGETAQIKGPVSGATVSIAGLVRGSIDASNRLEILPTGKVHGNITVKDLIIRSGALFIGKSTMSADETVSVGEENTEKETATPHRDKAEYEVE